MQIKRIIEIEKEEYNRIKEDITGLRENLRKGVFIDDTRPVGWVAIADSKPYEERPQSNLISREYVESIVKAEFVDLQDGTEEWRTCVNDTCENILIKVHNAPTAVPERLKGEWKETGYETGALGITYRQTQCSNCGWEHALPMWWNFCPNCGAEMRRGSDSK